MAKPATKYLIIILIGVIILVGAVCAIVYLRNGHNSGETMGCARRDYDTGIVCVCTDNYCDELPPLEKLDVPNYQVFTTNKAGLRMERSTGVFQTGKYTSKSGNNTMEINRNQKYQTILGWGGCFTDAFGVNMKSLNADAQRKLMRSYFSENGLEYNVGRVPIGASDFSLKGYTYDDTDKEDLDLSHFSLRCEDYDYKLPYIHEAKQLKDDLKLFAAAWAAPKWMKTNGDYGGFGEIKDTMYQIWADYHKKFLDSYKKENVTFWGITTGNEPMAAMIGSPIASVNWRPHQMQKWIADHLGPMIRNSEYKDLKIIVIDGQRAYLPWYLDDVLSNKTVKDFVDMVGVHWYWDDVVPIVVLDAIHERYPDIPALCTEASTGSRSGEQDVVIGSWERGVDYATNIIEDLEHHFVGWIDWNFAVDLQGGPSYIHNECDAPILVNATSQEFYKQPMYYTLGHFSKFIPEGSIRIKVSSLADVTTIAFLRPDNAIAVVIQNKGTFPKDIHIEDNDRGKISLTLSADSLTTVVYY